MSARPLLVNAAALPWESLGIDAAALAEIKPLVTADVSTTLGAGLCRFERCSFPWRLSYDECVYVIEGRLEIEHDDELLVAGPGEVVYVPAGADVVYSFPGRCLLFYATYPVNWQELLGAGS